MPFLPDSIMLEHNKEATRELSMKEFKPTALGLVTVHSSEF